MRTRSMNTNKELDEAFAKTLKSKQHGRKKATIIKKLLQSGANINHQDCQGNTLLHNANSVNEVQLLLNFGAKSNVKNFVGETPLLHIIRLRQTSIDVRKKIFRKTKPVIRELLRYGSNVKLKDFKGKSPLFEYISKNECDLNIVKQMVNLGANVFIESDRKDTLLHAAVSNPYCKADVVKFLIELGLDPKAVNYSAQTPLHCCVKIKNVKLEIVEKLLKYGAGAKEKDLYHAILNPYCNLELFNLLIKDADLSFINETTFRAGNTFGTLLHTAVLCKNIYIVASLIRCGADVNIYDGSGSAPLHVAVMDPYCNERLVSVLAKHGANVNARDLGSRTPLHIAFRRTANMAVLKTLLQYKPKLCALDRRGSSPFHYAIGNPNFEISFLIELLSTETSFDIEECLRMTANGNNVLHICHNLKNILFLKTVLKYIILKFHSEIDGEVLKVPMPLIMSVFYSKLDTCNRNFYNNFSQACLAEISQMMNEKLSDDVTFYNVMTYEFSHLPFPQIESRRQAIDRVLEIMSDNQYPIYKDMVLYVRKEDFLMYLDVVKVTSVTRRDNVTRNVTLDAFSVQQIAEYLTKQDVINLIIAFSRKSDSMEAEDNVSTVEVCVKSHPDLPSTRELKVIIPRLNMDEMCLKTNASLPLLRELKVKIQRLSLVDLALHQVDFENLCKPCKVVVKDCAVFIKKEEGVCSSLSEIDQLNSTFCETSCKSEDETDDCSLWPMDQ